MSVLVRALPSKDPKLLHVYVKGAPETIKRLCTPDTSKWILAYTCVLCFQVYRPFTYSHMCVRRPFAKLS